MHISSWHVKKPELVIIDSKRLRQAGIRRLLDIWADLMGLTVKAVVPDALADTCCTPDDCEMIIISVGSASIEDAQHQASIQRVRMLMPQALLVVISDRDDPREICAAFDEGAVGFVPTSLEPAVAFQALSLIRSGGSFFPPSILSNCFRKMANNGAVHASELTAKQEDVFSLLCQGYPNKRIARRLGLSEATVKVHVHRILRKFGAANRTQLAVAAANQTHELGNGITAAPAISPSTELTRTAGGEKLPARSGSGGRIGKDDVKIFLQQILADGPMSVAHLEAEARMAGLLGEGQRLSYNKMIRAAADSLGVMRKREGFGRGAVYHWYLPDTSCLPPRKLTHLREVSEKDTRGDHGEGGVRPAQSRGAGFVNTLASPHNYFLPAIGKIK